MIYITNEDETFIAGIIFKSSPKKIIKRLENLLNEKLYEAESDIYDEYDADYNFDVIIIEKDFFSEELLDIIDEHIKLLII